MLVRRIILGEFFGIFCLRGIKVFCRCFIFIIATVVSISDATSRFQFRFSSGKVGANLLTAFQSLLPPSPATATTAESHVGHIVGATQNRHLEVVLKMVYIKAFVVAVLGTCSYTHIAVPAVFHTFLYSQIEHCFLLTIVNTCYTCQVALAFISFQFINHVGGYIFHRHLLVVQKEFLTVNQYLIHRFTIDGDIARFIDLGTRQLFY